MRHKHPDIGDREFDYVHLDEAFNYFAWSECAVNPTTLLETLQDTIAYEHDRAIPLFYPDHPHQIWAITTVHLVAHYQVLPDRVEIGPMESRMSGDSYEPKHDLHATFTE
ncbi:hypothetical protein NG895_02420 [Aeoliella sp. ICT_H6.2]|uniref:Uncharacterized protein n=1 Tax=Aeoliella straminimaris TaxID=2954799 RepID=A0A9X2F5R8_9BACT|nr:hypothetical protein [Aeoliella straminimaris]MCO6042752.1 hypothetical protein [Aeoliella straminimaris]